MFHFNCIRVQKQTSTTEETSSTVTSTADSTTTTSTTTSSSTTSSTTSPVCLTGSIHVFLFSFCSSFSILFLVISCDWIVGDNVINLRIQHSDSTTKTSQTTKTTQTAITTPTTSIKTVTAGGTVSYETVTVVPTTTPGVGAGAGADTSGTSSSKGLSSGAAAGIAIGVLALIAIIAGIIVFFWLQRRKRRQEKLNSRPHSGMSGSQGVMSTPTTTMASIWDGENTSTGRRSSRLMPHDFFNDTATTEIYTRFENKSRESINTLQDNQDYSRKVLRTTNPDPPEQ